MMVSNLQSKTTKCKHMQNAKQTRWFLMPQGIDEGLPFAIEKHTIRQHEEHKGKLWFWRPQEVDEGLKVANNFSGRGPGGVWRGGFHQFASCRKEDLRIGSEEVWRFGGLVRESTRGLNALSHKGSADFLSYSNI